MRRTWTWKWLGRLVASVVILALSVLTAITIRWMFGAGPTAGVVGVARVLTHGLPAIDDFKHYPGRSLRASASPYQFPESAVRMHLPSVADNDTVAFLVIKDNALVFEEYYQGYAATSPIQVFSVSKSVTSMLVGMAIDDGYIRSVDQPITDFVPELGDQGFEAVTLKHLLTMTSSMDYVDSDNPFGIHAILNLTPDLEKMILDFRVAGEPGQVFQYRSGDNALLGLVLQRALSPESITNYAQRRIWSPLGMQDDGVWSLDRENGLEKTWCCLATTGRERMACTTTATSGGWCRRQMATTWPLVRMDSSCT